ncbi:Fatty acyl-CoA reductase [Temnothorax longispinosus]|uniref:Fatty acyl-CoA reductase n=1 Tax=Temnothorax longispinosus TaxID=300112 RepID=A0A4S2KA01_9HYME|nr:Fatty acyl-CoA reductase [Temnothorax longispinosus]
MNTEVKPYTVVDMCENLDDETIGIIEKRLIGKHPNTYTLTKGLAEQIVMCKESGLLIAIVRPSIVCAAYQEPFLGWIDNTNGFTFRTNKFIHAIIVVTLHFLPAFIVDLILRVQGCKPMYPKKL